MSTPPARRSRLRVEALEPREVPASPTQPFENFDRTALGSIPATWSQWSSPEFAHAAVASGAFAGPNALALSSPANVTTRAWLNNPTPANFGASAEVFVGTAPTEVIARGRNLASPTPTDYSAALSNGGLQLNRTLNGVSLALGSVAFANVGNRWLRLSLWPQDSHVRAEVYDPAAALYLNAAGGWQAKQTYALDVTDITIGDAGSIGVSRPGGATGTARLDDFTILGPNTRESFDQAAAGQLPAGWSQWSSDTTPAFVVATGRSTSAPNNLTTVARAGRSAYAWLTQATPADVQVSASVYADGSVPGQLFVRGTNLTTGGPSYYGVSVARGLTVQLSRVIENRPAVLGSVTAAAKPGSLWLQVTLSAVGNRLQVQVYRPDRQQYFDKSGQWVAAQTWAIDRTDAAIAAAGQVGVARPAGADGAFSIDDFTAAYTVPDTQSPRVSITAPGADPVRGTVTVVAAATDDTGVARVEFWIDGVLKAKRFDGPYIWNFDTSTVAAGTHTLLVRAYDAAGNVGQASQTLTVADTLPPVVNILAPGAGLLTGPVQVTAAATDDVGITKVEFWLDGTLQTTTASAPFTWTFDATAAAAGDHALVVRAYDAAGNVGQATQTLTVADTKPPTVGITSPGAGPLHGTVTVAAAATDDVGVVKVEFYVDGALKATSAVGPYAWGFDTTTILDGTHELRVKAYDAAGNVGQTAQTVAVQNGPHIPRHYSHIRVAELAYDGTPFTAFEDGLLQNSVDLVVSNPKYLQHVAGVSPGTPQLVYTNVSNVYGSLLTDWLTYADAHGFNREDAFYHVSQATLFSGGSPGSQPVTWFWDVRREQTDLTAAAHNGTPSDVAFGGMGQSVSFGYPDPFREMNFQVSTPAGKGWSGAFEYASAVDANGNPTAWAPLTLLSDGTAGFMQSGRISFDPPADWKAATLNGGANRLFYVRVRTVSGGTAPVIGQVLGRDFVNANGGSIGVIPAFDSSADLNHDGYLSDAEYANRALGKDARFADEGRLFYPYYGQMRYATNPSSASVRAWAADYQQRFLNALPLADGLFVDNSNGRAPTAGIATVESTATYAADYGALLGAIDTAIAPRWIMANTAAGNGSTDQVIARVPAEFEEFALRPMADTWGNFYDAAGMLAHRRSLTTPPVYSILDTYPTGGSATDPRTQIATLAEYYLLADPTYTFLQMNGGNEPASSWTRHWTPAIAFDVGQPQGGWSVFATGADPANPLLNYQVFQRSYGKALVLYKPLSYKSGVTGTTGDTTATVHDLGGTYRPLQADGTLGAPVTQVSLRNGEGAILVKV